MKIQRLTSVGLILTATLITSCLGDKVVAPDDILPPDLAINRPFVQLFRYARGRMVTADTVRITNNGEGPLGRVEQVGGVDYLTTARSGWLRAEIVNVGSDQALLVLNPTYAEDVQEDDDVAEIVLKAEGSPELRYVTVTARTLPGASFEFSVSPLAFAAAPGEPATSQRITVRNGGNGSLTVHTPEIRYQEGVNGWLSVIPAGGTETAPEFEVRADPEFSSAGGLLTARLLFTSKPHEETRAEDAALEVQLNVGQPRLDLSTSSLGFTVIRGADDPDPEQISLSNGGAGSFGALGAMTLGDISYGGPPGEWLEAALVESDLIRVNAKTGALPAGPYTAQFPLESENGGSELIQVALTVEAPVLTPSSGTVSFGIVEGDEALPAPATVRITNTGSGTLSALGSLSLGQPQPAAPWLTISLVAEEISLSLTPSASSLGEGTYATTLPLESEFGGTSEVEVVLAVSRGVDDPVLSLSATAVEFGGIRGDPPPAAQVVQVSNSGGGSIGPVSIGPITYTGQTGWLSASVADSTLTLSVTTGSLPEGDHHASVTVVSQQGGNAAVDVTFGIGSPILTASALSASFSAPLGGAAPPAQSIVLSNTGPGSFSSLGVIAVGTPTDQSWLSASLSGQEITLAVTSVPSPPGAYPSVVPVSSAEGGNLSIQVTLTVVRGADAPDLVVSHGALHMSAVVGGTNPPDQTVYLTNGGGGSLGTLGVSESAAWLSASLTGAAVALRASTGTLSAGTYQTTVTFTSTNGGDETTNVTLTMGSPILTLSSESASFSAEEGGSASPPSIQIDVLNAGAGGLGGLGTVNLGAIGSGWLNATLSGAGDRITLSAAPGALVPGIYQETIPVTSQFGGDSSVAVTLTVTPEPDRAELALSSTSVAFFAQGGGADPATQWVSASNAGGGGFAALAPLTLGSVDYGTGPVGWLARSVDGEAIRLDVTTGATPSGTHSAEFTVTPSAGGQETLTVTFTVDGGAGAPILELGAGSVYFSARFGSDDPPQRSVAIINGGSGSLGTIDLGPISYGPGASGWLSDSQNTPTTLTLIPRTGTIAAGTYTASVPVSSSNDGSKSVDVTFQIERSTLSLETAAVSMAASAGGGNPSGQNVAIVNSGSGDYGDLGVVSVGTPVYIPAGTSWLNASIASEAVSLQATTGSLSPGVYRATVPVSSTLGGDSSFTVTFTVRRAEDAPNLVVSPPSVRMDALEGGANPPDQTLQISNDGGGDLGALAVVESAPWLSASPPGSTTTLSADVTGLGAGNYSTTLQVTSINGGNESVDVTLVVSEPILTLSAQGLSFTGMVDGAAPPAQSVAVSNTGSGTLSDLGDVSIGTVTYGAGGSGWLAAPTNGSTVSGGSFNVRVSQDGRPAGTYTASLPVLSEHGGDQAVSVTLSVVRETDPAEMQLSTTTLRFGALLGGEGPSPQLVYISNGGGGSMGTVQVGPPTYSPEATGWLSVTLGGDVMTASASTGTLESGDYTAVVPVVSAEGGSADLEVTLVVGAPRLTVTPRTVSFGDTVAGSGPLPATATVANTGGGDFSSLGAITLGSTVYTTGTDGWLTTTLNGSSLTLSALTDDLETRPDAYEAWVPLESPFGGADTVSVLFTVAPGASPPRLSLSVDSLVFGGVVGGGDPSLQTVTAFNGGGGDLGVLDVQDVTYQGTALGWLSHSLEGSTFSFRPSIEGIPGGHHRASVVVGSEQGGMAELSVGLDLAQPVLNLSTTSVTFSDTVGSPDTLLSKVFITNTGGGDSQSLGPLTVQSITFVEGRAGWLTSSPMPGAPIGGNTVELRGSGTGLSEGNSLALVQIQSQWGGTDTVYVAFSARQPDRSFDLPTIELVRAITDGGAEGYEKLPGDSVVASVQAGSTTEVGLRVGVRNGSETRITLSGLRVNIPSYPAGQESGWITGAFLDRTTATFSEPAELAIAIDPSGLPSGRYEASLSVSSEAVGLDQVEPRTLKVILQIG